MPVAIAVWSLRVEPGEPIELQPEGDLVITNAALSDDIADEGARTSIKLRYLDPSATEESDEDDEEDDEEKSEKSDGPTVLETILCSLTPGKVEQAQLNLTLDGESEYLIQAVGKNAIYLTGNYVDQSPGDVPYNDESDEDEDDYDLAGSDLEDMMDEGVPTLMGADDDDEDRFEELPAEAPKSAKRARESDAMDTDKPSKAQEKKAKKQKAADGAAVPAAAAAPATPAPAPASAPGTPATESKKDKKAAKKAAKEAAEAASPAKAEKKDFTTLPSGLQTKDMKTGTGPAAKAGQTVSMRYVGKLQNGKVFDSNTKGSPFTFKLGKGEVIKGWDEGIKGMQVGGERLLVVPAALAYGKQKIPGIPPNSTLTFETKLVNIK